MIPPDAHLKFQIKSVLHLYGVATLEKELDEIAESIFGVVFDKNNMASIRYLLVELQEEKTDD